MGAPLQSFYPPSLYGVPTSVYPYQQPGTFPGPYGGGGTGGGATGTAAAGGSTAGGNFYGESKRRESAPEKSMVHSILGHARSLLLFVLCQPSLGRGHVVGNAPGPFRRCFRTRGTACVFSW